MVNVPTMLAAFAQVVTGAPARGALRNGVPGQLPGFAKGDLGQGGVYGAVAGACSVYCHGFGAAVSRPEAPWTEGHHGVQARACGPKTRIPRLSRRAGRDKAFA